MARHDGPVEILGSERFNKRCKEAHRFEIADTRGRLELTVPIAKPYGHTWADTRISDHGSWWETIPAALESAYGRTPFFEFYAPDLLPLLSDPYRFGSVADMNEAVDRFIRRALDLTDIDVAYSRRPDVRPVDLQPVPAITYWQVRAQQLGFIGGLSILDPIFNLGPEARTLL